jgi:hypothetical protein
VRFRWRTPSGFDRASALLAPRSIYHLAGAARRDWEHSIAAMEVTRWSITNRRFTAETWRAGVAPADRAVALIADRAPERESPARNHHDRLIEMLPRR